MWNIFFVIFQTIRSQNDRKFPFDKKHHEEDRRNENLKKNDGFEWNDVQFRYEFHDDDAYDEATFWTRRTHPVKDIHSGWVLIDFLLRSFDAQNPTFKFLRSVRLTPMKVINGYFRSLIFSFRSGLKSSLRPVRSRRSNFTPAVMRY